MSQYFIFAMLIILGLLSNNAFAQCIQNTDWPDAPCFDTIPVDRAEFKKAWAPYYDYKGKQWMESKKIELIQSIRDETFHNGFDTKIENYNVYSYYLSVGQVPNQYSYFRFSDEISLINNTADTPIINTPSYIFVIAGIATVSIMAFVIIKKRK